jgi:hypothetical protein
MRRAHDRCLAHDAQDLDDSVLLASVLSSPFILVVLLAHPLGQMDALATVDSADLHGASRNAEAPTSGGIGASYR